MMKKIFLILTVIVFTASWSFAADDVFSKIDKNKDGKISKQEYMDAVAGSFDKQDKNHDGILTRDELPHMDKKDIDTFSRETDTDKNNKIIKKEFEQAAEKRFSSMDKNKDGYIDKNEWKAARSAPNAPGLVIFTF